MIAAKLATIITVLWICYCLYKIHTVIQSMGSWYNHLKMEDRNTYINRVKVTLEDRVDIPRTVAFLIASTAIVWVTSYIFIVGVLNL